MIKVGDKIRIIDPYSVFYGEILTVQDVKGGRFVSTTPAHPRGKCICSLQQHGSYWVYVDDGKP